jgi:hypothetical protein
MDKPLATAQSQSSIRHGPIGGRPWKCRWRMDEMYVYGILEHYNYDYCSRCSASGKAPALLEIPGQHTVSPGADSQRTGPRGGDRRHIASSAACTPSNCASPCATVA